MFCRMEVRTEEEGGSRESILLCDPGPVHIPAYQEGDRERLEVVHTHLAAWGKTSTGTEHSIIHISMYAYAYLKSTGTAVDGTKIKEYKVTR